jgi:hypothetical protein
LVCVHDDRQALDEKAIARRVAQLLSDEMR